MRRTFPVKILMSVLLQSTQLFINITTRSLKYIETCFDPHLDHIAYESYRVKIIKMCGNSI